MKIVTFPTGAADLRVAEGPPNGPPVVLLHGVVRRWEDFEPILPVFLARWLVFVPNFRGHGGSGRTPGAYRVIDYAKDVTAFIERYVGEPVALVGHSLGGMVAVAVAAERPDLVRGVVLEDPPFEMMGRRIGETAYLDLFRAYRALLGSTGSAEDLAAGLAEVRVRPQGGDGVARLGDVRSAEALRFLAECLREIDPEVLTPIIEGRWLEGYDTEDLLGRVTCPALFLQADFAAGGALPDDLAERLAGRLSRGRLVRFEGVGHQIHATRPEEMLKVTIEFLESLDRER